MRRSFPCMCYLTCIIVFSVTDPDSERRIIVVRQSPHFGNSNPFLAELKREMLLVVLLMRIII